MPLIYTDQVAVAAENYPGAGATLTGADVIDALSSEYSDSQELIERNPATGTLSQQAQPVGRRSAEASFPLDAKGSGTATTEPRYARLIRSALYQDTDIDSMALSVALTTRIEPGDILTGATSGATAIVMKRAEVASTAVMVIVLSGTFSTAEQLDSTQKGSNVGSTHATTVLTVDQALAWQPTSRPLTQAETTGTWSSGTPTAGTGLSISFAGTVIAEASFVSWTSGSPDLLVMELHYVYGTIPDGATVTATGGSAITLDTPANITATTGQTVKLQFNSGRIVHSMLAARSSFQLSAEAGQPGKFAFTVQGQPQSLTEADPLTATGLATTSPPRFAGGVLALRGLTRPVKSFAYDAQSELVRIADGNSMNGEKGGFIVSRKPSLQATIERGTLAPMHLHDLRDNGTTFGVGFQLGTVAGNTIVLVAPAAQISDIALGDDQGIGTYVLDLKLTTPGSGDDEVYIGHL